MSYASQTDITDIYGANALYVADHDRDGVADEAAIARALTSAAGEIDTYIGVRYALPLVEVPEFLKQLAVDIALYRLALSADVATTEHRTRYEDALLHLRKIAEGKAALVFAPVPALEGDPIPEASGPQPIVISGPPRLFSRDQMRDL